MNAGRSCGGRAVVFLLVVLGGCRSLADQDREARRTFFSGDFQGAVDRLDPEPETKGKDRLLFLANRGVILHTAGRYDASNGYLLDAARMIEDMDVIRISEQAGTIVTNEKAADYRGEDFERVLLHTYVAMNFLLMGDLDSARVEAVASNRILEEIADDRGIDYRQNPMARYLSGLTFELQGEYDQALVDYRKTYELLPSFGTVQDDLLRLTARPGFEQEHAQWVETFHREYEPIPEPFGELVILYECGLSPEKAPNPTLRIIPAYNVRGTRAQGAQVVVNGEPVGWTEVLFDIEGTAIRALKDREALLILKRAAAIAAKEAASRQIENKWGEGAGVIARIILYSLEQPDLRSWITLPQNLQLARLQLAPGVYRITLRLVDAGGGPAGVDKVWDAVTVEDGKATVLNARSVR